MSPCRGESTGTEPLMEEAAVAREGKGGVRELPHPLFPLPLQLLPSAALNQQPESREPSVCGPHRRGSQDQGRGERKRVNPGTDTPLALLGGFGEFVRRKAHGGCSAR